MNKRKSTTGSVSTGRICFADLVLDKIVTRSLIARRVGISPSHICNMMAGRYTGLNPIAFRKLANELQVSESTLGDALRVSRERFATSK